eukprot:511057-Amphidinium_carterae.1
MSLTKPADVRAACRSGEWSKPTAGLAPGFVQANLVILPSVHADDFLEFCSKNPAPCPVLEATPKGIHEAASLAPGSDLRTDLPKYLIWRD